VSLFDLDGRVVVVTGALGQLGRQFCDALVAHGARVAGVDLADPSAAAKIVHGKGDGAQLRAGGSDRFTYTMADVIDRGSLEAARQAVEEHFGAPIFGLVNNAALDSPPDADPRENGPFETYPIENWDKVFAVNARGPFLCSQVFGASMVKAGQGSIVNVGSIYGIVSPDQRLYQYRRDAGEAFFKPVAYSASKSALYNLTRYLAGYWGEKNVRVNIVTFAGVFNNQDKRFLDAYLPKVPLGRMANASDYNGTIVYLMSDASAYMTGSNMVIDGGFSAL
jgi:NAD(P)-dependent dehydrogenase (short-subunit alcohol dehydrogenase family)